jgi:hypothetical protein
VGLGELLHDPEYAEAVALHHAIHIARHRPNRIEAR